MTLRSETVLAGGVSRRNTINYTRCGVEEGKWKKLGTTEKKKCKRVKGIAVSIPFLSLLSPLPPLLPSLMIICRLCTKTRRSLMITTSSLGKWRARVTWGSSANTMVPITTSTIPYTLGTFTYDKTTQTNI